MVFSSKLICRNDGKEAAFGIGHEALGRSVKLKSVYTHHSLSLAP